MNLVKQIRVGEESTKAGFCAEQDRPPAILCEREIRGVCITEDTPAQGDELMMATFYFTHNF